MDSLDLGFVLSVVGLDKTQYFQKNLGRERRLTGWAELEAVVSLGMRSACHMLSLESHLYVPNLNSLVLQCPLEEKHTLARRGQCCFASESRPCPLPHPFLTWLLLGRQVPEFLPLSGEDGVSGAGICPSLVLDIQIPHSDLPPTPGTSPYPSSPGHRKCEEDFYSCSAAWASGGRGGRNCEGRRT